MAIMKEMKGHCDDTGGKLMPLVNFNNCGAEKDCIAACPYDVLEMRTISTKDKANLNLKGRIKTFFVKEKAYITDPALCRACGLCVQACPENAIKLTKILSQIL